MGQGQGHQMQRGTVVRIQGSLDLDLNPDSFNCCCSASEPQFPHPSLETAAAASEELEQIPRGLRRGPWCLAGLRVKSQASG